MGDLTWVARRLLVDLRASRDDLNLKIASLEQLIDRPDEVQSLRQELEFYQRKEAERFERVSTLTPPPELSDKLIEAKSLDDVSGYFDNRGLWRTGDAWNQMPKKKKNPL